MADRDSIRRAADELSKRLTDDGKIIEAGFAMFRAMVIPVDAPEEQVGEMRLAFLAGAQHLWGSINSMLDGGDEPTVADLKRMDLINEELSRLAVRELEMRTSPPRGSA